MTPTEIFKLFLKEGLEPNERLALTREIRGKIYRGYAPLCHKLFWYEKQLFNDDYEKTFVERLIRHSWYGANTLGRGGRSSSCSSLSSFMRYLLYYVPSIIGTYRNKNRFLEMVNVKIPKSQGYKRYWELRLIKKWHDFLKENVKHYDRPVYSLGDMNYSLINDTRL